MNCENLLRVLNPKYLLWVLPVQNSARPVWMASVIIDSCVYGPAQFPGYLLTNVLWLALGACLVTVLVHLLTGSRFAAFAAAALFAAHPIHAEAVNLVSFRSDTMALFFMTLSLCLYLQERTLDARLKMYAFGASVASFVAALLSKEMAVTLPLLLVLADLVFPERAARTALRRRVRRYGAFAAVVVLFMLYRSPRSGYDFGGRRDQLSRLASGLGVVRPPVAEIAGDPGRARLKPDFMPWREVYENPKAMFLTMSGVFGQYLRLLVFPLRLQGDYSPPVLKSWIDARALASWAGWLLLAAAAWALRRSVPAASFGLAWTGATLLPVCGLVSLLNLQAERYLYVPSAGACIAAGALLEEFRRRAKTRGARVWVVGSAAALVAAGAARTVARNRDFASEELFLRATDAIDPSIPRVHFNLARLRAFAGDSVGAEAELRKALSIWPQFSAARLILARQLMGEARWEGAIEVLEATPEGEAIEETRYLLEFSRWRRTHRDAPESEFARVWAEKARKG